MDVFTMSHTLKNMLFSKCNKTHNFTMHWQKPFKRLLWKPKKHTTLRVRVVCVKHCSPKGLPYLFATHGPCWGPWGVPPGVSANRVTVFCFCFARSGAQSSGKSIGFHALANALGSLRLKQPVLMPHFPIALTSFCAQLVGRGPLQVLLTSGVGNMVDPRKKIA